MSPASEGLVAVLDANMVQDHPGIHPQHFDDTAVAHVVVTANTAHFRSPRFVDSGQIRVQAPAAFLAAVFDKHHELMIAVLAAENRRSLGTVADVLDQLDRNQAPATPLSNRLATASCSHRSTFDVPFGVTTRVR